MAIVTSRRRQSAANTTSVRARWRILRNCATLWDGRSPLGATNTSILKPTNFATSRPPARILCVRFGRKSITPFSNVWCACDYGKQRTIVLLCAERSTTVLSVGPTYTEGCTSVHPGLGAASLWRDMLLHVWMHRSASLRTSTFAPPNTDAGAAQVRNVPPPPATLKAFNKAKLALRSRRI